MVGHDLGKKGGRIKNPNVALIEETVEIVERDMIAEADWVVEGT